MRDAAWHACRWLGHGTMILLTLHGWGFWALWLWEGEYIRGFFWDSYGALSHSSLRDLSPWHGSHVMPSPVATVNRDITWLMLRTNVQARTCWLALYPGWAALRCG